MRLNIKKIEIENFRSVQNKIVLEIVPGLFSIEGINYDEEGSGNGAGKSTILSALYWCLTGNALTNEVLADEVVNIKAGKDCKVIVYIESDQGEIKITRTRKDSEHGNNLILEIAGQDVSCHKIVDTQVRLNQIIKIPEDLLKSTIIMTSGMESAFSELSPQQRVQALESIRDYSLWDKVRDTANKDIKDYNKEIQEKALQMSQYSGSISTYNQMLETEKLNLNTLKQTTDLKALQLKIDTNNNTINDLNIKIIQKETELTDLKASSQVKSAPITKVDTSKLDTITQEANKLKADIQSAEFDKKGKQKDIEIIDKWFKNDKCPTCGKPLDRTEEEIKKKTEQKQQLISEIAQIETNISQINTQIETKRAEYKAENENIQKQNTEIQNTAANIAKIANEKNQKVMQCSNELTDLNKQKSNLENENLQYTTKINTFDQKVKEAEEKITTYMTEIEKQSKEVLILEEEIKKLEKKRQLSDYFYKLLGSKGELRPFLLNKDIEYLNQCMQKYISVFFKNTDVELKLNGASIDININSSGIKKNVSSLSGGEKKRLNLAIQLGLYDLISSTAQVSFNTLWLDEVESEVDQQGIQQLIQIIEDISEKVETVMWITNNPNVKEAIPDKIICKKKCGKTELEVTY